MEIFILLWGTIRSVGRRLMDGIEPELLDRADHALEDTPGLQGVGTVRLHWSGHQLSGDAVVILDGDRTLADSQAIRAEAESRVRRALPKLDTFTVHATAGSGTRHE